MTYRIGIYDPAFRAEGHFVAFDRYIKNLVADSDTEVIFIDRNGQMKAAYAADTDAASYKYLELPQQPAPISWLPVRAGRVFARLLFWRRAFQTIERQGFDLVIFTADPRDIIMCFAPLRVPYAAVIMYPYGFVSKASGKSVGSRVQSFLYKRYLLRAKFRFTTNELPILSKISALLGMEDIHWIPDVPAEERPALKTPTTENEFLTIGTISKSKNHLFVLDVFRDSKIPYSYRIAGKPMDDLGHAVVAQVSELAKRTDLHISGDFGYLDDVQYLNLMQSAKFLIFPYDFTRGDISSQVLHDAFSTGTPFVAPDIEPFRWYAERYSIGILYPEGDAIGLANAVHQAHKSDRTSFLRGFEVLRKAHALPVIRQSFQAIVRPVLKNARTSSNEGALI